MTKRVLIFEFWKNWLYGVFVSDSCGEALLHLSIKNMFGWGLIRPLNSYNSNKGCRVKSTTQVSFD